jgi:hypothetical protein
MTTPLVGSEAIEYLHPLPGSSHLPKETVIITRFKDISPDQISNRSSCMQVKGEKSGIMTGNNRLSSDNKTLIFYADRDYMPGEIVKVKISPKSGDQLLLEKSYQFEISPTQRVPRRYREYKDSQKSRQITSDDVVLQKPTAAPRVINGVSVPSDFPEFTFSTFDNPYQANIFVNTYDPFYCIIFDYQGNPLYYLRKNHEMMDFKLQPDGRLTAYEGDPGCPFAMDSSYTFDDRFHAPPGYWCDDHEIMVLPNGEYYIIVSDARIIDMSQIVPGGFEEAEVVGNHIAHMDADHNPIWIWRGWDHFEITDASDWDLTDHFIDFMHTNAIDFDIDGNLLISSRHLSEITKINRQSGEIMWRLGGKNDYFTWVNDDDRISYQHDIRSLPNGHYTIFDNGNFHNPHYSRVLELELNTASWTATKVWEFRDSPDRSSWGEGSARRLPNGNTLINWTDGEHPFTEVRPNGEKAFEAGFIPESGSYRIHKFNWEGKARVPNLIIEPQADNIALLFNKFGDYDVDYYNIYGGQQPQPTEVLATSTVPYAQLYDLENGKMYYFKVTAVNTSGIESDYSEQKSVFVNIVPPGTNFVTNGDFSDGINHWQWDLDNDAVATWEINQEDEFQVTITNEGSDLEDVQLAHPDIPLVQGQIYVLEFDARAIDSPRVIEVEVKREAWPFTNYSRKGFTYITTTMKHYSHEFEMEEESQPNSQIVINVGGSDVGVILDNISLKLPATSIKDPNKKTPIEYHLADNFPNPFNPRTIINYELPITNYVDLSIYNNLGQKILTLVDKQQKAGYYQVEWDATNYASGIYYYRLKAGDFHDVKKMILFR